MSYRKGSTNNIHAKIKRDWSRAMKKRRTSERRQVRDVAARLLGREFVRIGTGEFVTEYEVEPAGDDGSVNILNYRIIRGKA